MFFGTFLGPILALVLFNTIVFVLVIRVLIKHSSRKMKGASNSKKIQGTFKTLISIMSIMFMFGFQWLFGALTIAEASLVFQWLFVIFSTLQGSFLFIFFVVLGKETRGEWLNVLRIRRMMTRRATTSQTSRGNKSRSKPSNLPTKTTQNRSLLMSPTSVVSNTQQSDTQQLVSDAAVSSIEMTSLPPAIDTTQLSAKEEDEIELVIVNENTYPMEDSLSEDEEIEKVDMSDENPTLNCKSGKLEEGRSEEQDFEIPPYILHGRCMHSRLPKPIISKDKESTSDVNEMTTGKTTKQAANEVTPPVIDSQVPPHIAERRHRHKPTATVAKQNTTTVVNTPVPEHVLESRFFHTYTSAPTFMTPKMKQT